MKKKEAEEILVRITDKYKPFHPEKSQSVRVLARLLRHVADDIYDEDALFCFELLTREQVNDILSERNGVRFSYYFKAFLPRNSNEYETIVERIPRNSYFWVTICSTDNSGYNSANGSIQLDGYTALRTPIPKKYWSDERMHHNGDARMVIGDSTNAEEQNLLENFVQVTDSYKDS